jgi:penicillin-binding protein 1A
MQPNALQFNSIDITRLDNATLLSYMHQVYDHGQADATMQAKMGQWWTGFGAAYLLFDQVINPSRKSLETEDLKNQDSVRDSSLGAYHEALLGLQRNPNDQKRQAARQLLLNYDAFGPKASQEYMKETELIDQMTKEIDDTPALTAAVTLLGLGDYLDDLKAKNQAFAALMSSRTASTQGQVKGAVAAARADLEAKYQLFRRLLNVAAVYEGDTDYRPFLLAVNAEVEHYRQILARKGGGGGTSSDQPSPDPSEEGGGSSTDPDQGGDNGGGTTPDPDQGGDNGGGTTPDPDQGGGSGGSGGGDNGGDDGGLSEG